MIKLIASDLDGTLVNDKKEFAPDFFDILKRLQKFGIKFCVASGRSTYALKKVFSKCRDDIYYISDNGGYISGRDIEETLLPLSLQTSKDTVKICLEIPEAQVIMCAKDKAYFVNPDEKYIPDISFYYTDYEIISDYTKVDEQILKVAVFDPVGSAKNAYPYLKDKLDKTLVPVVSSVEWLDIMDKRLNKGLALDTLQKHFGIKKSETMAFGDFNNDIELLKEADYSFAMQNATDAVKNAANYIAPSNNDFGVVQKIKEIALFDRI